MKLKTLAFIFALSMGMSSWAQETKKTETAAPAATEAAAKEVGVIKTTEGEMVVEFWSDVAPNTVENFKKLARSGFYDKTAFHRIIKGFMIQGGDPNTKDLSKESSYGMGDPGYKIKAEFNARPHDRGVLSMARGGDVDSAGSQFFLMLGRAPSLDGAYTAFGKVIKGEDVLMKIGETPVRSNGRGERSKPQKRVEVESITIVRADSLDKPADKPASEAPAATEKKAEATKGN